MNATSILKQLPPIIKYYDTSRGNLQVSFLYTDDIKAGYQNWSGIWHEEIGATHEEAVQQLFNWYTIHSTDYII